MKAAEKPDSDYASPAYRELERLFERSDTHGSAEPRMPSDEGAERAKRMVERVSRKGK